MLDIDQALLEKRQVIEAEEYRELLQRLQADFANYKRRVERERGEQARYFNSDLIQKLLPVLDDLGRALNRVPDEVTETDWVKGIALVDRKLRAILKEEGLSQIDARAKEFDPWEHEAVFTEESNGDDEGRIISVIRDGYKLHDKVIRPAQVSVTKGNGKQEPTIMRRKAPVRRR